MGRIGHALLLLLALAQGVWAQAPVAGAVAGAGAGTSGAPARSTPAQATGSVPAAAPGTATGAAPGAAPSGTSTGQVGAPAAELRNVTGVVFVQSVGSQARIVQAGTTLVVGDTVGTNKGAFALIVFNDGSRVALRPESAIAIKGFSFKPEDPSADQMSVQLLKGWLRNVSGQIGKRGNRAGFELRVVDSTIGIRGTDFAVRYCDAECAAAPATDTEGVLPQSGRLGSLLASDAGVQRLLDGQAPQVLSPGDVLRLGDVIETTVSEALIGLDDGTRVVMGPATRLALRAEEDERGRRALRLDVLQGTVRVATPPQPGARLYGLLLNAGQLLGVRQDSALDLRCEQAAEPGAFSCASAVVNLRRGRSEVLTDTGLRSLRPGVPERLAEPGVPAMTPSAPFLPPNVSGPTPTPAPEPTPEPASVPAPAPAPVPVPVPVPVPESGNESVPATPPDPMPSVPQPLPEAQSPPGPTTPPTDSAPLPVGAPPGPAQSGRTDWDTWAPGARPMSAWRTLTRWEAQQRLQAEAWRWPGPGPRLAQLSPPGTETPGPGPRTSAMFDPLDLPADLTRPPSTAQVAVEGIYTAVFSGLIELANPAASILIAAGQGGFAPIVPTLPPQLLPTAPAFLERDRELERGRLYPEQCPR
ncbi:MAG: FecR domain-containing protein [Rubrivivax sp.]